MDDWRRRSELEERAARAFRRLEALESATPGRFAFVKAVDDVELLIDPRLLWGPPRVAVRRGHRMAEIWLDPEGPEVSSRKRSSPEVPDGFTAFEVRRLLALVADHLEELTEAWFALREDWRRGRLGRNVFVD